MSRLIQIDESLSLNFDQNPFSVRHRLAENPLFAMDRLLELARRLRSERAEFYAGDVPVNASPEQTPATGLSLEETIRRTGSSCVWVVLKNVEQDSEYRALLERCLDEVADVYGPAFRDTSDRVGFIFISSAKAITPCHIDAEHNFLLQIRGSKTIHVGDRSFLSHSDLERYFTGGHRNVELPKEHAARAAAFRISPGDGVHVPFTAPHWVVNGDDVSVSFSITFQNPESRRRALVHKVNAHLRKTGMNPNPPGRWPLRDAFKVLAFETVRQGHRLLRSLAPRAGART